MKNRHIILTEGETERRLDRRNPTHHMLYAPAPPTTVVLGIAEPNVVNNGEELRSYVVDDDGNKRQLGRVSVIRTVSTYDGSPDNTKGEGGMRKFSSMSQLDRMWLERDVRVYGRPGERSLWTWEESTDHGLTGLAEYHVIDPHLVVGYREVDGRLVESFAAGPVTRLVACKGQGKPEVEWCENCSKHWQGNHQLCQAFVKEVIPPADLEYRPTSIFKPDVQEAIGKAAFQAVNQSSQSEMEKLDPSLWAGASDADIRLWLTGQENAITISEAATDASFVHFQTVGGDSEGAETSSIDESAVISDGVIIDDAEDAVDIMSRPYVFRSSAMQQEYERISRATTPKNRSMPLGRIEQSFLDDWSPEGHPVGWLGHAVFGLSGNNYEDFVAPYAYSLPWVRPKESLETLKVRARLAKRVYEAIKRGSLDPAWESWFTEHIIDELRAIFFSSEEKATREAVLAQWAKHNEASLFGLARYWAQVRREKRDSRESRRIHGRYLTPEAQDRGREAMTKVDGRWIPSGEYKYWPGEKVEFKSQADYLCWRLDNTFTLGATEEIDDDDLPVQAMMPLREAWPVLYQMLYLVVWAAADDRMDLTKVADFALARIDQEHASWHAAFSIKERLRFESQPILQMVSEFERELEEAMREHGRAALNVRKYRTRFNPDGDSVVMSYLGVLSSKLARFWRSGKAVRINIEAHQRFKDRWHGQVGRRDERLPSETPDAKRQARIAAAQYRAAVRDAYQERWQRVQSRFRQGFTLPCGLDLQHASESEMLRCEHVQALGRKTARAFARAIVRRRIGGHMVQIPSLRWNRQMKGMKGYEQRLGVFTQWDLFDLPVEIELHYVDPVDDDGEVVGPGFFEGSEQAKAWKGDTVVNLRVQPRRVRTSLFRRDCRDKRGRWTSSDLSLLTSENPTKVRQARIEMQRSYLKSRITGQELHLLKEAAKLRRSDKLLHPSDYQALHQRYRILSVKLRAQLAKAKQRR